MRSSTNNSSTFGLSAAFNGANHRLTLWRATHLTTRRSRFVEALGVAAATAALCCALPLALDCSPPYAPPPGVGVAVAGGRFDVDAVIGDVPDGQRVGVFVCGGWRLVGSGLNRYASLVY